MSAHDATSVPQPAAAATATSVQQATDAAVAPTVAAEVWAVLRTCYDPEIPVDIVELGLVYDVRIREREDGSTGVEIDMTLTAPACSMSEFIRLDVEHKVNGIERVSDVTVNIVFEPPWTPEKMSEAAKLQLGMF